jgi:hypothetical protein
VTATLYVNNVWFKTIRVDKFHDLVKYIIPRTVKLRPMGDDIFVGSDHYELVFLHVGYGFYHIQVHQKEFETIFKDRYA